jgi:hypothetical protein
MFFREILGRESLLRIRLFDQEASARDLAIRYW